MVVLRTVFGEVIVQFVVAISIMLFREVSVPYQTRKLTWLPLLVRIDVKLHNIVMERGLAFFHFYVLGYD